MSEKRRDSKNRILRSGESQRKDGRYAYKYIDATGKPQFVYSWKLEATDSTPQKIQNLKGGSMSIKFPNLKRFFSLFLAAVMMVSLTEKRFKLLSDGYEREQEELDAAIVREQAELDAFNADTDRADQFLELVKRYTDFSVLTTPMILEFVDKIVVHAPDRSSGERMQEVDIYLKFIGKFDVPLPEPTPEELAEQERLRKKREKQREYSRRSREKKKRAAAQN